MSLDVKAELEAALADPERRKRVRASRYAKPVGVEQETLVRFSLAPVWTRPLMEAALFSPDAEPSAVAHALEALLTSSWARSRFAHPSAWSSTALVPGEDIFWVEEAHRQVLLEEIIQDEKRGQQYLKEQLESVGRRVLHAQERGLRVLDVTASWATFAAYARDPQQLAKMVDERMARFLHQKQPAEARQWLEGVRQLDVIQEGEFSLATSRAERQVELLYRRADDERRLRNYYLQEEQLRALEQLLEGPDTQWGLHFMGPGGAGKTMLMRYLSSRLAPERKMTVARVDFDHLDPSYPSSQPGLLLRQLGAELRLQAPNDAAARLLSDCDLRILRIHEELQKTSASPEQIRGRGDFKRLVRLFAEAMCHLPQPVVLLLDTCEELARLTVGLGGPKNVDEALAMLEMLVSAFYSDDRLQSAKLRVVFSGRRPLANKGVGWELARPLPFLQERPFLRLHEVGGFQEEEARCFLLNNEVPEALIAPILEKSRMPSQPPEVLWGPSARPKAVPRFLPYRLAQYAQELDKEAGDAQRISENSFEQYLSLRIIERLRSSDAERLLPAAVLLGEFTRSSLRKLWAGDDASFAKGLNELAWQEWVEHAESERYVLQPRLRYQLEQYYAASQPETLRELRKQALEYLEPLTLQASLSSSELRVGDFFVVLRLLTEQPQRLATWWARVERRLGEENIAWLRTLTSQWMGAQQDAQDAALEPGTAELPKSSPIQAALLASRCAVQLNEEIGAQNLHAEWREVEQLARTYPDEREGRRLRWRARAGMIAGSSEPNANALWDLMGEVPFYELDEQLGASLVAAAETVIEYAESSGPYRPHLSIMPGVLERFSLALASKSPSLSAFARTLVARAHWSWGKSHKTIQQFSLAIQSHPFPLEPTRQRWLDWLAPENVGARVRVEAFRALYGYWKTPASLLRLLELDETALPSPKSLDTDRLMSVQRSLRHAIGGADGKAVMPWMIDLSSLRSEKWNVRERNCHRDILPLFTVAAEQLALSGRVREAWGALSKTGMVLESFSNVVEADSADIARVHVAIRMRLSEGTPFAKRLPNYAMAMHLRAMVEPSFSSAGWGARGIPAEGLPLHHVHATWRAISTPSPEGVQGALSWARQILAHSPGETPYEKASLGLDLIEAELLRRRSGTKSRWDLLRFPISELEEALQASSPEGGLTLALRVAALCEHSKNLQQFQGRGHRMLTPFAKRLGLGRAAELALEEGELLALRLPVQAQA